METLIKHKGSTLFSNSLILQMFGFTKISGRFLNDLSWGEYEPSVVKYASIFQFGFESLFSLQLYWFRAKHSPGYCPRKWKLVWHHNYFAGTLVKAKHKGFVVRALYANLAVAIFVSVFIKKIASGHYPDEIQQLFGVQIWMFLNGCI